MYKQTDQKQDLLKAFEDFHHEFINENLMISHKMLSENYRDDLNNLFNLYTKVFDFTDMEMVMTGDIFFSSSSLLNISTDLFQLSVSK